MPEPLTPAEIRYLRQALGLTQEGLARKLDVTLNTVARWEREDEHKRTPDKWNQNELRKLARKIQKGANHGIQGEH